MSPGHENAFYQFPRELARQFMPLVLGSWKSPPLSAVSAPPKCDQQQTLYHPNVIKLFQVMETVDHVYTVMEHHSKEELLQYIQ
jgi:hypothetical protein